MLGGSSVAAEQSEAMAGLASRMRAEGVASAPGIPSAPPAIVPRARCRRRPAPLALGLAEETLEPFALEPAGAFALAGPPASGRTSARVIAERLFERGDMPVYYVGNKRSPLADSPRFAARATTIEAATELAKLVREIVIDESTSRVAVIIEAARRLPAEPGRRPAGRPRPRDQARGSLRGGRGGVVLMGDFLATVR